MTDPAPRVEPDTRVQRKTSAQVDRAIARGKGFWAGLPTGAQVVVVVIGGLLTARILRTLTGGRS